MTTGARTIEHRSHDQMLGSVLWLGAMTIMAAFQTWRGAFEDGILFFTLVIVLAVDRFTGEWLGLQLGRLPLKRWMILTVASIVGIVLVVAPRHGTIVFVTMIVLGVAMIVIAWAPVRQDPVRQAQSGHAESSPAVRRSVWLWVSLGVAVCLWEGIAFVLSVTAQGGSEAHPTVSVLLDPMLETVVGRIVFVGLWIAGGVGLVFIWRRK